LKEEEKNIDKKGKKNSKENNLKKEKNTEKKELSK